MAVTVELRQNPMKGDLKNRTIEYIIKSDTRAALNADDVAALDALDLVAPADYDGLRRTNLAVEQISELPVIFIGTATYGVNDSQARTPGTFEYEFEYGTENENIKFAISKVAAYTESPGDTAADHGLAINVQPDGEVEGVDIFAPTSTFSLNFTNNSSFFTSTRRNLIQNLTGKTNSDIWQGHQPGELLFLGASGRIANNGESTLKLSFSRRANVTGLAIGGITGINKKGWEYLWVSYGREVDGAANRMKVKPQAAYVMQVYESASFLTNLGF